MKVLIGKKKRFIVDDDNDFHSQYGVVKKADLKKPPGTKIKTNIDYEFTLLDASYFDLYNKLKKRAQTIPIKDLAYILGYTLIGKEAVVAEAGTGSGASSIFFSRFVKKAYSYDIREDHQLIAIKNIQKLGVKNVVMKIHNVYDSFPVKNVNLILLDLPEPWNAIESALKSLKVNGWLVSYSPTIPQISDFREKLNEFDSVIYDHTVNVKIEEWDMNGRVQRPLTRPSMGHSGFLCFARKIKN